MRIDSSDRGSLTAEEIDMISRMDDIVDGYDEDCPPMPEAMRRQIKVDIANKATINIQNSQPEYDEVCSPIPEIIEGFKAFGRERNERRRAMTTAS